MMTAAAQPARSWAASADPAAATLADLERAAFAGHPDIRMALATAPTDAAPPRRRGSGWLYLVLCLLLLAPVVGVAIYGSHRYLDLEPLPADVSLPIAVGCFAVTVVSQIVIAIAWLRYGAPWAPALCGYGVVTALLAGLAAAGVPNTADEQGYVIPQWWLAVIWVACALGVVIAVAALTRVRATPAVAPGAPDAGALIRALPRQERSAIRADRDAALQVLLERGLLSEEHHRVAGLSGLGTLDRLEKSWNRTP